MQIDPKGTVAGWPALVVRRTLRELRTCLTWGLGELESAASVEAAEGRALIKALLAEGLIEAQGQRAWKVTPGGTNPLFRNGGQTGHTCDGTKGVAAVPWPSGAGQQRPVFPRQSKESDTFRQHVET